jgi:SSU ribosomal protein S12P methylthiotransferase (EC 2.-.-.-)
VIRILPTAPRCSEILSHRGYELTSDIEEADAAVINTCCFIQSATEESIGKIFELAEYKKEGT